MKTQMVLKGLAVCISFFMLLENNDLFMRSAAADNDENAAQEWYGGCDTSWYDEEETVFHLKTTDQLAGFSKIANEKNETFEGKILYLDRDMNMDNSIWQTVPIFSGIFDAQNHSILNLRTTHPNYELLVSTELFSVVKNGTIRNLNIECGIIYSKSSIRGNEVYYTISSGGSGGICGCLENGLIESCNFSGGLYLYGGTIFYGGICGKCVDSSIRNCSSTITGLKGLAKAVLENKSTPYTYDEVAMHRVAVGGVCGFAEKSYIISCLNKRNDNSVMSSEGIQDSTDTEHMSLGGICGYAKDTDILI